MTTSMKAIKILVVGLMAMQSHSAFAQTFAKGNVQANEPYEVHIMDIDKAGNDRWVRWELWEYYGEYRVNVAKGDTIKAVWVSVCTGDTLARAQFIGGNSRYKHIQDIALDGSTFVIGKNQHILKP